MHTKVQLASEMENFNTVLRNKEYTITLQTVKYDYMSDRKNFQSTNRRLIIPFEHPETRYHSL